MCVCVRACACMCARACVHARARRVCACVHVCTYICTYVRTYVRTYVCACVCTCVCAHMRVQTYVPMYVRTHIHAYMFIWVHTYICIRRCCTNRHHARQPSANFEALVLTMNHATFNQVEWSQNGCIIDIYEISLWVDGDRRYNDCCINGIVDWHCQLL